MIDPQTLPLISSDLPVWFQVGWMLAIAILVVFNTGLVIRQLQIVMELHMYHRVNSEMVRELLAKDMMPGFSPTGNPTSTREEILRRQARLSDTDAEASPQGSASRQKGKSKWSE